MKKKKFRFKRYKWNYPRTTIASIAFIGVTYGIGYTWSMIDIHSWYCIPTMVAEGWIAVGLLVRACLVYCDELWGL